MKTATKTSLRSQVLIVPLFVLMYLQGWSQEEPILISPIFGSGNTTDVVFADENNGYILNETHVYRTEDGGVSWSQLPLLGGGKKLEISGEIIAVMSNNEVILSADGGESWETIYSVDLFLGINDIALEPGGTLFVITDEGMRKTSNGGSSWTDYPTPEDFSAIHFFDALTGLAGTATGKIYKTINGGQSWLVVEPDPLWEVSVRDFVFPTSNIGFYLTGNSKIFKTTDGGENWEQSGLPSIAANHIDFLDENTGILGTVNGAIFSTQDGGETWQPQAVLDDSDDIFAVAYQNSENVYAVGPHYHVHKSDDQGDSWDQLTHSVNQIRAIDQTEGGNVFIQGIEGLMRVNPTLNTCQLLTNTGLNNGAAGDIEMITENLGYALFLDDQVKRTEDGGQTWTDFEFDASDCNTGKDFSYANGMLYLSSPCGNRFYMSDDLGYSWTMISGITGIGKIHVHNENLMFIYPYGTGSSPNYLIYKSTNGGISWGSIQVPETPLRSAWFVNENVGYASGGNDLFKTTDGGETWINIAGPSDNSNGYYLDIAFIDEDRGWLIGFDSGIFETLDGGSTWTHYTLNIPTPRLLKLIGNTIYVGGSLVSKKEFSGVVSTSNMQPKEKMLIYPNPVERDFTIVLPDGLQAATGRFISTDGRLAATLEIDRNCSNCALSIPANLALGMYLLEVETTEGKRFVQRAVLQ